MIKALITVAVLAAGTALAAQEAGDFFFSPAPRWQADPDQNQLCEAMRRDCPEMAALPEIATSIEYDELYDASSRLVGLRMTRGTGCAPYDESILLSQRDFRNRFRDPDRPDPEVGIRLELGPGVDPAAVRMVKPVELQVGMGCPQ